MTVYFDSNCLLQATYLLPHTICRNEQIFVGYSLPQRHKTRWHLILRSTQKELHMPVTSHKLAVIRLRKIGAKVDSRAIEKKSHPTVPPER